MRSSRLSATRSRSRLDLIELRPGRAARGVGVPLHAIARYAERGAGAQHLLGAVLRVDRIDVGRHQRDRHAALPESLHELGQVFLDARGLDVSALRTGASTPLKPSSATVSAS
jgi:hypothetical protein